jgi:hypothetical protein
MIRIGLASSVPEDLDLKGRGFIRATGFGFERARLSAAPQEQQIATGL